jgi:hypothetical protein
LTIKEETEFDRESSYNTSYGYSPFGKNEVPVKDHNDTKQTKQTKDKSPSKIGRNPADEAE